MTIPPPPPGARQPADPELLQLLTRIEDHARAARAYLGILVVVLVVLPIIGIVISQQS